MEAPALNPTGGVKAKQPVGLDYRKDPTRPGGGVFIAHGRAAREGDFEGIPAGVIISGGSSDDGNGNSGENRNENGGADGAGSAAGTPSGTAEGEGTASAARAMSSSISLPAGNDRDRAFPFSSASLVASSLLVSSAFAPPLPNDATSSRGMGALSPGGQGGSPLVNFTPLATRGAGYGNVNPAMNAQAMGAPVQVMNVLDGPQGRSTLEEFALADGFLEGIPGGMFDWGRSIGVFGGGAC